MSKVRTFQRVFPSYHPHAGKPTYFVEKIWNSLYSITGLSIDYKMICDLNPTLDADVLWQFWISIDRNEYSTGLKHHTIRAKQHLKVGDWFSPRVWGNDINPRSGRRGAYHSKQIIIAPDIQVKKKWRITIDTEGLFYLNGNLFAYPNSDHALIPLSSNDGLSVVDFLNWFKYPLVFDGQIICWNDQIEY